MSVPSARKRYKNAPSRPNHYVSPSCCRKRECGPQNFNERRSNCCDKDFATRDAKLIKGTQHDVATVTMRYYDLRRTGAVGLLGAYVLSQPVRSSVSFLYRVCARP